ncbi:MAG: DUF4091 domain-containing protein [Candidatus Glassbacteria bacterium]|nr:DUF4091 domain-containing protein [Candidatus Glassbacteria bacterium]
MSRSRWPLAAALLVLTALAARVPLHAAVVSAWAVGDGEKIFRYQDDSPLKQRNSVWDGSTVRLKGLYNEVLAFQVIVEADGLGARAVEVAVEPPVHAASGKAIGAPGPPLYGPGGTIEVFSEHYIRVRRPTQPLWFYGSEASAPKRMTGWIPSVLIPPDARAGRGGFPIDIPPTSEEVNRRQNTLEVIPAATRQNQGFWVDLHLPRDRSCPAGLYQGRVKVYEAGRTVAEIKLEVTLLPHYLPDENHSNIWLYGSVGVVNDYFPELSREEAERMLKFESHRHRIDLVGGSAAHTSVFDERMMEDYKPYVDGSAFTPEAGYSGPGQGCGERLFTVGCYGSITNRAMADEASTRRESDLWVQWFEANAPGVVYFWYMIDEPGPVQFPWIKEHAGWVHDNPGPGKRLPVFTTREYTEELAEDIDIWAGGRGVNLEQLPALKSQGRDHWFYNGRRPRYGAVILEAEAVDFRVNAWVKYLYGVSTWFLWEGTHWQHNFQGPKGHLHQRVFTEPLTFISWSMNWANGDGVVLYPGRMPFYPEEDRGLNRLLGSIRLKNMRRGQQDYEIMWLAEQKAGRDKVLEIIRSVVPRGLNEVGLDEPVPWSERGDDYDLAREKLLGLLGK